MPQGLLEALDQAKTKPNVLRQQRDEVTRRVIQGSKVISNSSFKQISTSDLQLLFRIIDEEYFDGQCWKTVKDTDADLSFRLSRRMTSCGGTTTMETQQKQNAEVKRFEIAVATTLLFDTYRHRKSAKVGGVSCSNPLDALARIMEHEMVHLIELLIWNDSNCSAKRFQQISWRRFGHLESNHQLMTPSDVAKASFGIRAGDQVAFQFEGARHVGWVNRITKRATVLVTHPQGTLYNDGKRYLKFYVPVSQLRKLRKQA